MSSHSQYACFPIRRQELDSCGFAMLSCTMLPQEANLAGASLRSSRFSTEQVYKLVTRFCRWKAGRLGDCQRTATKISPGNPVWNFRLHQNNSIINIPFPDHLRLRMCFLATYLAFGVPGICIKFMTTDSPQFPRKRSNPQRLSAFDWRAAHTETHVMDFRPSSKCTVVQRAASQLRPHYSEGMGRPPWPAGLSTCTFDLRGATG